MPEPGFVIVRDPRGSLVHVRNTRTGACVGCIEVGLFEIVRTLIDGDGPASGLRQAAIDGGCRTPAQAERSTTRALRR